VESVSFDEAHFEKMKRQHAALQQVMATLTQSHVELAESHKRLDEARAKLKKRVDAFIRFVEKDISRGSGSKKRSH